MHTVEQAKFIERSTCINCGSKHFHEIANGSYRGNPLAHFLASDPWGENPLPFLQSATWSIVKCGACGQIFHRRILDEEWNERRFSKWMSGEAIAEFAARRGPEAARTFTIGCGHVGHILRIERLTRLLRGPDDPVRLLDFGCGFGEFLEACAHFGFDVAGVDRALPRRDKSRVKIVASLDGLPKGQFHAITLFETLEHLDHPAEILKALYPLLHSGGLMILETPDCAGLSGITNRREYRLAHPLEHINCFTHETLTSIAERAGFKKITRGPALVMADPRRIAKRIARYLLRRDGRSTQLYFRKPIAAGN